MTRTSRTLLILILMSIGTVVVLAMMAQRYGKVLEVRQQAQSATPGAEDNDSGPLADAEAARNVAAYLHVTSALGEAAEALGEEAASSQDGVSELRRTFERALVESRLERAGFQEMDAVVRAWNEGSDEVPQAYRRELDRRAAEVKQALSGGYDPLER
jgi:hypothetical protein